MMAPIAIWFYDPVFAVLVTGMVRLFRGYLRKTPFQAELNLYGCLRELKKTTQKMGKNFFSGELFQLDPKKGSNISY